MRLDKTGVLNGFIIFFTATDCPVNWSRAELYPIRLAFVLCPLASAAAYQTRPNAPMPTGWRSVYLCHPVSSGPHPSRACNTLPAGDLEGGAENLGPHKLGHGGGRGIDRSRIQLSNSNTDTGDRGEPTGVARFAWRKCR